MHLPRQRSHPAEACQTYRLPTRLVVLMFTYIFLNEWQNPELSMEGFVREVHASLRNFDARQEIFRLQRWQTVWYTPSLYSVPLVGVSFSVIGDDDVGRKPGRWRRISASPSPVVNVSPNLREHLVM